MCTVACILQNLIFPVVNLMTILKIVLLLTVEYWLVGLLDI